MKNIVATAFLLFFLSLNCLAKCEKVSSFEIENFISDLKKEKEKRKSKDKDKENKPFLTSDGFTISGMSGSSLEYYPTGLMTWGIGFSENLARITVNKKSGFINRSGRIVIKPKYTMASCFSEGLAAVAINEKWGFINKTGKLVIPAKFDAVDNFSEGLALVKVGKLWGYINPTGNFVIKPRFEDAESFSEGFAAVGFYDKNYIWTTHSRENGKWVSNFIDKKGALKFPANFDGIDRDFSGGMALVSRNVGYKNGVLSESYFIDTTGRELWKLNSWHITWFSDDLIVVAVSKDEKTKRDKYSFLDRSGKRLTENVYDYLDEFSEGFAAASINNKYGFIDKSGSFVIEPKFSSADGFSEGLAAAWIDEKSGFIDSNGIWKINLKFDWTNGFKNGRAAIATGQKVGYIDRNGNYIWKPTK